MYMRRVASPWWWLARPKLTKAETGPCLQSTCIIRSDAYACVIMMGSLPVPSEKNVPSAFSQLIPWLWPAGPSLAMLAASEYRSQTRRERFFAPGNLSPIRLCWQPTLHRLGVRGCGTARMEGTFFSLGTDSGKMVLHCCFVVCACVTPSIVLQNVMFAERFANITLL